jgi:O-antigen ligase
LGLVFGFVAYKNFRLAAQIFICLLPTYLIRINIGPLPSTALEVAFGFLTLVWLIRYALTDYKNIRMFLVKHRIFSYSLALFFVSSLISIFISDMWWYSFGQWRAYFLEPIILFFIFIGRDDNLSYHDLLRALCWSSASVALYAIIQKLFDFGLDDSGRAVSFFTSPNAVGLYLAPLMVLLTKQLYDKKDKFLNNYLFLVKIPEFWLITASALAVVFTRSLGTVIGLIFALVVMFIIIGKRNFAAAIVVALVLSSIISYRMVNVSNQKFQSFQNRITLWTYSFDYLTASPKNYIFGTGLRQFFRKIQKPYYNSEKMERLIYPHNIFLNFWTEIGFIGLLGFAAIMANLLAFSQYILQKKQLVAAAACLGIITVIIVHGLVDVPYFKNDLAMMFWILTAYIIKVKEAA